MFSERNPRPIKFNGQRVKHNDMPDKENWPIKTYEFRMKNRVHKLNQTKKIEDRMVKDPPE